MARSLGPYVVLLGALACAPAQQASQQGSQQPSPAVERRDPNVISAKELADPSISTGDALTAIRHLRPNFLIVRPGGSIQSPNAGSVHVSIDGGTLLTTDELKELRVADLKEIRYLNATDAAKRFGTLSGTGGVILVQTR
jgi:hypothetical protein